MRWFTGRKETRHGTDHFSGCRGTQCESSTGIWRHRRLRERASTHLPKGNLYDLRVEQGGYGAGTIIHFKSRLFGVERTFHHQVIEPEPGRVLREQSIDDGEHEGTTFTVMPIEQGAKSRVEIATTLPASPGLQGFIERFVVPLALAPVYRKELALLQEVAQQRAVQAPA